MKRLKLGMVGGGQVAFIGALHRIASRIEGRFDLVAGALSSDPARAAKSVAELGIERSYDSYESKAIAEAARVDGIDAVAIVTLNHMHAGPAIAFLNAGIHVIFANFWPPRPKRPPPSKRPLACLKKGFS